MDKRTEALLHKILMSYKIMPNLEGFTYICDAMDILWKKGKSSYPSMQIYKEIAAKHDVSHQSVERSIRYAIRRANTDHDTIFGFLDNITCSVFLSTLYVRLCNEVAIENK